MKKIGRCALLTLIALASLHVNADMIVKVSPPAASVCVSSSAGEAATCLHAAGGVASIACRAGQEAVLRVTADGYALHERRLERCTGETEIALTPLPKFRWRGWRGRSGEDTFIETAQSLDERTRWSEAKAPAPGQWLVLPEKTVAVRLRAADRSLSPRTYYYVGMQTPLIDLTAPVDSAAGGEVTFCTRKAGGKPVVLQLAPVNGGDGRELTVAESCVSVAGVPPATFLLEPAAREPRSMIDRMVDVAAGQSTFLGELEIFEPGRIRVSIASALPAVEYDVTVGPRIIVPSLDASRNVKPPSARVATGETHTWPVRPGTYIVTLRGGSFETSREVSVSAGGEGVVAFQPRILHVKGVARSSGEVAPNTALDFLSRRDSNVTRVGTTTDDDGRFSIELPYAGEWEVTASASQQWNIEPEPFTLDVPDVNEYEADVVLPGGRLDGRVVRADTSEAIANLAVRLSWFSDGREREVMLTTGADGSFKGRMLPAAEVAVQVVPEAARMRGYRPAEPVKVSLSADLGSNVEFQLERQSGGPKLRVRDATGNPAPGVAVFAARAANAPEFLAFTGLEGLAELPPAPEGTRLFLVTSQSPWHKVTLTGSDDVEVILPPPALAPVRLRFVGSEALLATVGWGFLDADGDQVPVPYHCARQGEDCRARLGTVQIPFAVPGVYQVWVSVAGAPPVTVATARIPQAADITLVVPH